MQIYTNQFQSILINKDLCKDLYKATFGINVSNLIIFFLYRSAYIIDPTCPDLYNFCWRKLLGPIILGCWCLELAILSLLSFLGNFVEPTDFGSLTVVLYVRDNEGLKLLVQQKGKNTPNPFHSQMKTPER